jgi:hypothetical protein
MTCRLHMDRTAAKDQDTYVRTYSFLKSEPLNTNIQLILYRAVIRSVIVYACPTCMWRTLASWNCSACRTELSALLET